MAFPDTFNGKLKLAASQLAIQWIKDSNKSLEQRAWAKSQLLNLDSNLDAYFTVALQAADVTVDTSQADFKTALEALLDDAYVGYNNGSTYVAPGSTSTAPLPYLTRLGFLSRFTQAELAALYTAAAVNVNIQVYKDKVLASTYIDPAREDTRAGIQALETAGLLAAGRALEILDTPIVDSERYNANI